MTDQTRLAALEAVAEAADNMAREGVLISPALYNSLKALRTLPAQPQPAGEGLTLAVWADRFGTCYLAVPGTDDDADNQGHRRHLATVTIPIARVEPGA